MYGAASGVELGLLSGPNKQPFTAPPPRRSGRARTSRVRDDFIDADFLQYVTPPDEPLAFAPEEVPAKKSPPPKPPTYQSVFIDDDSDDTPLGPDYQASIPAWCPRPAQPTAAEAKFLPHAPLYTFSALPQPGREAAVRAAAAAAEFKARYSAAQTMSQRHKLLASALERADRAMGPQMVKVLSLDSLGAKRAEGWQPHEELLFCLGMCDKYRMFKYIRQCYLWSRSAHELNGYYHNVWKTRSTPEADTYLGLREAGASAEDMWGFVDTVRDKLVAMWDKKTMGDMPKLVKDAVAAAAVAAGGPDPDDPPSEQELSSTSMSAGAESNDSDSSSRRAAAAAKKRQRRRAAAAAAAVSAQAPAGQQQVKLESGAARVSPLVQGQQQAADALPTPTGTPALQQWLQPKQASRSTPPPASQHLPLRQQQQQRQRLQGLPPLQQQQPSAAAQQHMSGRMQQQQQKAPVVSVTAAPLAHHAAPLPAPQPTAASGTAAAAVVAAATAPGEGDAALPTLPHTLSTLQAPLQYPPLPRMPELPSGSATSSAAWLKALPAFRANIEAYMQSIHALSDAAVRQHQRAIEEVQGKRKQLLEEAQAYTQSLVAQGQRLLQGASTRPAAAAAVGTQRQLVNVPSAPVQQQQQQQQQQVPGTSPEVDLQQKVVALFKMHDKGQSQLRKQQRQAAAAGEVCGVTGPAALVTKCSGVQADMRAPASPRPDLKRLKLDASLAAAKAVPGTVGGGDGSSSSDDCDAFVACGGAGAAGS